MFKLQIGDKLQCNNDMYEGINKNDILKLKDIINKPSIQYYIFIKNRTKKEVCFLTKLIDSHLFDFTVIQ